MSYLIKPRSFSQKITYRPPVNMKPEWEHLFKPDDKYLSVKLGVRQLSNVFVNHYGLVIKNGLLVPGCAPNIGFSNYDDGFYFNHWRKAMEQMLVSRFGKSIPSIRLDDNRKYLVIHSPWFSNYFWITECIPRLLAVKHLLPELVLIYPESWKNITYVNDTLSLFPELEKVIIPQDHQMFVKNLIMPEVKPWTPMFIPEHVFEVRKLFFDQLNKIIQKAPSNPKSVYISRKKAKRRKFTDEASVERLMEEFGFETVCMEELTFFDQVSLMSKTELLASITGAGLINVWFMMENGGVLDLANEEYEHKDKYKFHYFKLCNVLSIDYALSFQKNTSDKQLAYYNRDLIPDLNSIKSCLKLLTENK